MVCAYYGSARTRMQKLRTRRKKQCGTWQALTHTCQAPETLHTLPRKYIVSIRICAVCARQLPNEQNISYQIISIIIISHNETQKWITGKRLRGHWNWLSSCSKAYSLLCIVIISLSGYPICLLADASEILDWKYSKYIHNSWCANTERTSEQTTERTIEIAWHTHSRAACTVNSLFVRCVNLPTAGYLCVRWSQK